ncbi:MAG: gliding motility lipoprotein GldH [Ginsengibacter sp.]
MSAFYRLILFTGLSAFTYGCSPIDVFEKTATIPKQDWYYNDQPSFSFDISDTASAYNIFITLRHSDAYKFNNIWLKIGSIAPGDSIHYQNLELQLASDARGWEGNGMDDIFEVRKNITPGPVHFRSAGKYTFTVAQIMRQNPLKNIFNVGIRVEKIRQQ